MKKEWGLTQSLKANPHTQTQVFPFVVKHPMMSLESEQDTKHRLNGLHRCTAWSESMQADHRNMASFHNGMVYFQIAWLAVIAQALNILYFSGDWINGILV